jgi:GntR family transcriptional repressor for pyruvate dehydrogenase complex
MITFNPVAREPSLTSRVTSELESLILKNQLHPGDRLPAVQELADQFGVSRTVIREAIGALAAKGLLEVRHGSRTTVRSPSAEAVQQSMALYLRAGQADLDQTKIDQVRRVLEVEIAGIAAEQRTEEDLASLTTLLDEMTIIHATGESPTTRDHFVVNDVKFHAALAQATHNELFVLLLNAIADIMLKVRHLAFSVPGSIDHAMAAHRAIFEKIRAGNPEGARQSMRLHLMGSEEILRHALAMQRITVDA